MKWNQLTSIGQLAELDEQSKTKPVLILKHSTRCSISLAALGRLERNWKEENSTLIEPFYLDLLQHRDVSNFIAQHYHIEHESPQALLLKNGKCIYSQTHMAINVPDILAQL